MGHPAPPRPRTTRVVAVAGAVAGGVLAGLVGGFALAGDDGPAAGVRWLVPAARALVDVAGVVAVGTAVTALLLASVRRAADALAATARAAVVAGAAWAAAALVLLWTLAAEATGDGLLSVGIDRVASYLSVAAAGRALLVTAGCALAVALAGTVALHRDVPAGLPVVPAVLGVLALPITGHAATAPAHELAVLAVAVHVAAASAWVGGFTVLAAVLLPRRELLAAVLPRFSRLAAACLAVVAGTGILNAMLRVPTAADLVTTGYGALLLAKTAGMVVLAGLGARARRRLLPAVAARHRVGTAGWVAVELVVMGGVLGLAAVLAGSPPPT